MKIDFLTKLTWKIYLFGIIVITLVALIAGGWIATFLAMGLLFTFAIYSLFYIWFAGKEFYNVLFNKIPWTSEENVYASMIVTLATVCSSVYLILLALELLNIIDIY